jgi:hypothetical protein
MVKKITVYMTPKEKRVVTSYFNRVPKGMSAYDVYEIAQPKDKATLKRALHKLLAPLR